MINEGLDLNWGAEVNCPNCSNWVCMWSDIECQCDLEGRGEYVIKCNNCKKKFNINIFPCWSFELNNED